MITKRKLGNFIKEETKKIMEEITNSDISDDVTAGECPDLMFYCGELAELVLLGIHFNLYSAKQLKEMQEFLQNMGLTINEES